jgi:hypothetical protein
LEQALARHGKPEIFNTDRAASSPARPSPASCWPRVYASAWTARDAGATTSSSSGCGGVSNTRRSICGPTRHRQPGPRRHRPLSRLLQRPPHPHRPQGPDARPGVFRPVAADGGGRVNGLNKRPAHTSCPPHRPLFRREQRTTAAVDNSTPSTGRRSTYFSPARVQMIGASSDVRRCNQVLSLLGVFFRGGPHWLNPSKARRWAST